MTKKIPLTIVIPVYNEASRLDRTFTSLNQWRVPVDLKINQVIFVNDGSTDTSLKILKNTPLKFSKKVISYRQNQGKGYAVRRGMLASTSSYTLLMDADIATPLNELKKLLPFMHNQTDLIIGTRKNGHSTVTIHQPWIRENMGKVFTKLTQLILGVNVTDFTCGFKAFSREAVDKIFPLSQINRWGYDSEIIFLGSKFNLSIQEVPVKWADQKGTKVNLLKDSINSLLELLTIRLNSISGAYSTNQNFSPLGILK